MSSDLAGPCALYSRGGSRTRRITHTQHTHACARSRIKPQARCRYCCCATDAHARVSSCAAGSGGLGVACGARGRGTPATQSCRGARQRRARPRACGIWRRWPAWGRGCCSCAAPQRSTSCAGDWCVRWRTVCPCLGCRASDPTVLRPCLQQPSIE